MREPGTEKARKVGKLWDARVCRATLEATANSMQPKINNCGLEGVGRRQWEAYA